MIQRIVQFSLDTTQQVTASNNSLVNLPKRLTMLLILYEFLQRFYSISTRSNINSTTSKLYAIVSKTISTCSTILGHCFKISPATQFRSTAMEIPRSNMEVDFKKLFEQVQRMRKNSDVRYSVIQTANSAELIVNKCLILPIIQGRSNFLAFLVPVRISSPEC